MSRRKLYTVAALLAFFAGTVSAPAGKRAAREAATFVSEQFDGNCANNFFPC